MLNDELKKILTFSGLACVYGERNGFADGVSRWQAGHRYLRAYQVIRFCEHILDKNYLYATL